MLKIYRKKMILLNWRHIERILLLHETKFSKITEKIWGDELNGDLLFSHGKTSSCGVLVGFYGNINYSVKNKLSDNSVLILITVCVRCCHWWYWVSFD